MHYILYKVTNTINNKIYIGKHKCQYLDDEYFGSGKLLLQAIKKHGIENFTFQLLIDLKNQDEMDLLEELVVNSEFLARDDVYNISRGGKNPCMYGDKNPFYHKRHPQEIIDRIKAKNKGRKLTEESKRRISEGLKRKLKEDPEIRKKFASTKGKKCCINTKTGERRYFDEQAIPNGFEIPKPKEKVLKTSEQRAEGRKRLSEKIKIRNTGSHWYNNGTQEIFCKQENVPDGYVKGRLAGLNVGRKYSAETLEKMRIIKLGKTPFSKGRIHITNGKQNKYISKDDEIPEGWWKGMTRIHVKAKNKEIENEVA